MNSFVFVAVLASLAVVNAGLLVGPSTRILQGPSTRTTVVGPDGSAISAIAPGGQIITEQNPGLIAQTAPALAYASPLWSRSAILAGPSGTISTLAAPAYYL